MMRRWKSILSVCLLLLLLFSSCCAFKKTRTETITITKVDTVIKVVRDTVLRTVSVPLYDTAYIETDVAVARSYYNVKTQKIDLQLKGKVFDVPVQLQRTQYIKQVEKENIFDKSFWFIFVFAGAIILFLCFHLIRRL